MNLSLQQRHSLLYKLFRFQIYFVQHYVINIIIMLRRVAKSALAFLPRSSRQLLVNAYRPSYFFAAKDESKVSLQAAAQQQIKYEEENKENTSELTHFFQNQGWEMKFDGIQIEISKKNAPYNIRMLFNAKTPMSMEGEQNNNQQEEQQQEDDQDFTQISAFINKEGSSKWLALDFMVTGANEAQVATASFITDYENEKAERRKGRIPASSYTGPELSSLENNLQQSLYGFIEGIGITGELLQRAAQFSVAYEQQFYIEWLKDLKSLA